MVWTIAIAFHVLVIIAVLVHRAGKRRPPCGDCGFVMTHRHAHCLFCPQCGRVRGRPGLVLPDHAHRDVLMRSLSLMLLLPLALLSAGAAVLVMFVSKLWH